MHRVTQILKKRGQWFWEHKIRAIVMLVVFAVAAQQPMKSQFLDPCCGILSLGLTTIGNTLNAVVGGGLKSILSVEKDLPTFQQRGGWPQKLIDQARSLARNLQDTLTQITGIPTLQINNASPPPP